MGKPLGLSLPEQKKYDKAIFDIRRKKAEQWIASLPMANVGETARLVHTALDGLNQMAIACPDRLRVLELFREPVHHVTESLKKHFVGASHPLKPRSVKIAELTLDMYAKMAVGYEAAVEHSLRRNFLLRDNKLLMLAAHRAVTYLGRVLLTCYQVYAPLPDRLWLDLHLLYALAERKRLHRSAVEDDRRVLIKKSSIGAEYKRLALLSLAAPYRFRHGEVEKVYVNLEKWAEHAVLGRWRGMPSDEAGAFVCVLDSDHPPSHPALLSQADYPAGQCRLLRAGVLDTLLREELAHTDASKITTITGIDKQTPLLSADLLRRLMLSWGVMPKRSFSRVDKRDKALVTLGLGDVHHFVRAQATAQEETESSGRFHRPASFRSTPVEPIVDQPDVWDLIYTNNTEQHTEATSTAAQPTGGNGHDAHIWRLLNESAAGCCLVNDRPGSSNLRVGELVGVLRAQAQAAQSWGIGTIRWMKATDHKGVQLGVQMLAPTAIAAGISGLAKSGADTSYHRCLMLPALESIGEPASIITPAVPYRSGHKLLLRTEQGDVRIQLTRMLENTGLFAHFHYVQLDEHRTRPPAESWLEEQDFSGVWSVL